MLRKIFLIRIKSMNGTSYIMDTHGPIRKPMYTLNLQIVMENSNIPQSIIILLQNYFWLLEKISLLNQFTVEQLETLMSILEMVLIEKELISKKEMMSSVLQIYPMAKSHQLVFSPLIEDRLETLQMMVKTINPSPVNLIRLIQLWMFKSLICLQT